MISHIMSNSCKTKDSIESVDRDSHIITIEIKMIFKTSKRKHGKRHIWDGICFFYNRNSCEGHSKLCVGTARGLCLYNQQLISRSEKQLTNGKGFGHD